MLSFGSCIDADDGRLSCEAIVESKDGDGFVNATSEGCSLAGLAVVVDVVVVVVVIGGQGDEVGEDRSSILRALRGGPASSAAVSQLSCITARTPEETVVVIVVFSCWIQNAIDVRSDRNNASRPSEFNTGGCDCDCVVEGAGGLPSPVESSMSSSCFVAAFAAFVVVVVPTKAAFCDSQ